MNGASSLGLVAVRHRGRHRPDHVRVPVPASPGGTADLAPLAVMSIGLLCGGLVGASFGFGLGLFLDVSLAADPRRHVAHPLGIGYFAGRLREAPRTRRPRSSRCWRAPRRPSPCRRLLDHPVPAGRRARRSAACSLRQLLATAHPQHPARPARLRHRAALAARAALPQHPRRRRRQSSTAALSPLQRACARRGRGGPRSHDRSRRRPSPADQPPARLAGRPPGRDRARALRDRLLPPLVPAGALRRPVPRRGERQPGPRGAHPGAARGDRRPQRRDDRHEPPGDRRRDQPRRPARGRARRCGDLGPAEPSARLRQTGFKGEPTTIPPIPTAGAARSRYRRLAGVLEDTSATEIHRRIIQSLAAGAVRADAGARPTCRARS